MSINMTVESKWNGKEAILVGRRMTGKSIWEIGLAVEGQAKLLAPIITGRLAGSITTQSLSQGTNVESPALPTDKIAKPSDPNDVYVGTAVDYGPYKEFGTRFANAKPFLRPALALAQGKSLTIVKKHARFEFAEFQE